MFFSILVFLELFSFNTILTNNRSDKHIFNILFTNLHHVSFKLKLNSILWNLNLKFNYQAKGSS